MDEPRAAPPPDKSSLLDAAASYLSDVQLQGDLAGFAFVRRLWRNGLTGRAALLALGGGTLATAYFLTLQPFGSSLTPTMSQPTVFVSLILFALAWAYAVAAASRLPMWAFVIVAVYLAWFGILPLLGTGAPILINIPLLWLLAVGWLGLRAMPGRWHRIWFLGLCLGAGYLSFSGFGLNRFFPGPWNLPARLALGAIYFALATNPFILREQRALPSTARLFWITLVLFGGLVSAAVIFNPDVLAENEYTTLSSALAFLGLLWMLLSFGAFDGAMRTEQWAAREGEKFLNGRVWRVGLLCLWILVTLYEMPATYTLIIPRFAYVSVPLAKALNRWVGGSIDAMPDPIYFAMILHQYVGMAVILASFVLILRKKFSAHWVSQLNAIWIGSFLILLAFQSVLFAINGATVEQGTQLTLGATVLLVIGVVWELAKSGADWTEQNDGRLFGVVALLLLALAALTFLYGIGDNSFAEQVVFYPLLGILFLGIPYLLLTLIAPRIGYNPPGGSSLAALFGLGWIGALPLVVLSPNPGVHLLLAPLWWSIILFVLGKRLARLNSVWDGVVAGATLGLGFAAFWSHPESFVFPFVPDITALSDAALARNFYQIETLWFTLGAVAVGALIGFVFARLMGTPPAAHMSTTH